MSNSPEKIKGTIELCLELRREGGLPLTIESSQLMSGCAVMNAFVSCGWIVARRNSDSPAAR